jgi:hypothetical protein
MARRKAKFVAYNQLFKNGKPYRKPFRDERRATAEATAMAAIKGNKEWNKRAKGVRSVLVGIRRIR